MQSASAPYYVVVGQEYKNLNLKIYIIIKNIQIFFCFNLLNFN
jgi:hypothetical protein